MMHPTIKRRYMKKSPRRDARKCMHSCNVQKTLIKENKIFPTIICLEPRTNKLSGQELKLYHDSKDWETMTDKWSTEMNAYTLSISMHLDATLWAWAPSRAGYAEGQEKLMENHTCVHNKKSDRFPRFVYCSESLIVKLFAMSSGPRQRDAACFVLAESRSGDLPQLWVLE